jgi:hypothetical protein
LGYPVPEDDYLAFIEPYEGMKHLRALRGQIERSDLVSPSPVSPLRTRTVALPQNLAETEGMAALHRLLTSILQGRTNLRAQQVALNKRKKLILTILWALSTWGEPSDNAASLTVEETLRDSPVDFRGLVRKRDNALHTNAAAAAELLREFGVYFSHRPLPGNRWILELAFDDRAGGGRALTALRRFVHQLTAAHGAATPIGAGGYRGEAFARFSRADMHDLRSEENR